MKVFVVFLFVVFFTATPRRRRATDDHVLFRCSLPARSWRSRCRHSDWWVDDGGRHRTLDARHRGRAEASRGAYLVALVRRRAGPDRPSSRPSHSSLPRHRFRSASLMLFVLVAVVVARPELGLWFITFFAVAGDWVTVPWYPFVQGHVHHGRCCS